MAEQTDDQRAAADVMTELHECAEGANPYGGMAARALALIQNRDDELARLRAELTETRAALSKLDKLHYLADDDPGGPPYCPECNAYDGTGSPCATRKILDEWRSVRGDAPTEPPADPQPVNVDLRDRLRTYPGDGDHQAPADPQPVYEMSPGAFMSVEPPAVARTDGQPPADLEGQALVDALVAAGWTRTGGQSGRYVRLKRDVPISNTALVPLDTSASDYTDLLDTARAEIGAVLAAPVVGYVLARVDDGTVTLWDDDVRETGHAAAVAHVEQVDQPGPWRCYELRDVCIPAGQPVRGSQPCRDCPPPGERQVVCGFCGTTVPTFAACENGLPWPTDDEQSRMPPAPGQDGGDRG